MSGADYPYTDGYNGVTNTTCSYDASLGLVSANGFSFVPQNNPKQMQAALNLGPIAVGIDASSPYFQQYVSGVLTDAVSCGTNLDHAVTVVGYNGQSDPPYFIVRNSWGASWGDNGYVYIAIQDGDGVCGINMEPSYPNLLLVTDSTEALLSYVVLGFGLLIVVPLTCLCIKKKRA